MKIVGHTNQQDSLRQDVAAGNLAHAYLFTGPPQIGKYSLARRLAKILQCAQGGCEDCAVCLNIEKGYHSDTLEMAADELITIEVMRDTLARLSTTAVGRYKILLIKNIERMKPETANTLLKSLEEPASAVVFIFTTSSGDDILPTILSRVRTVKFKLLEPAEVLEILRKRYPLEDAPKLANVADLAFGLPGRAVMLMENPEMLARTRALFERVRKVLMNGDVIERFALVEEVTKDKKDDPQFFREFCDIFLLALRYRMLEEAGEENDQLLRTASVITGTQRLLALQKNNINARLAFENLMLQL